MASARDLMQKADALMRNNRNVGGGGSPDQDIPVLTDIVIAGDATVMRTEQAATARGAEPAPVMPPRVSESPKASPPAAESGRILDELARQDAAREAEKREIAESVFFEVLRDLDVDTVDGMRQRLSAQLMPLFEDMSRELVARAEQALTQAIREQVAAAIEKRLGSAPRKPS